MNRPLSHDLQQVDRRDSIIRINQKGSPNPRGFGEPQGVGVAKGNYVNDLAGHASSRCAVEVAVSRRPPELVGSDYQHDDKAYQEDKVNPNEYPW